MENDHWKEEQKDASAMNYFIVSDAINSGNTFLEFSPNSFYLETVKLTDGKLSKIMEKKFEP